MIRIYTILLILAMLLLHSCGDYGDYGLVDPPEPPVIETGSGVIGTLGGLIYVGDANSAIVNSVLVIPEGALSQPVTITITTASPSLTLPGDPAARIVRFQPEGLVFNKDILIGLWYGHKSNRNPWDYKIVHYQTGTQVVTDQVTADADTVNHILYALTNHFSHYALTEVNQGGGSFGTLDYQGKKYRTIAIGSQVWMADNLNYAVTGSYCLRNQESNCDTYGRLYTWDAARRACPSGWHLPTDADWQTLEIFLGMDPASANRNSSRGSATNVGGKLKETRLWKTPNEGATNETGFSALPADQRFWDGSFTDQHDFSRAYFWTDTESPDYPGEVYYRSLVYDSRAVSRNIIQKSVGFSVRCIKN